MTLEPTREEWLAARERISKAVPTCGRLTLDAVTEAALGPCPPEPPPEGWHAGSTISGLGAEIRRGQIMLWAGDSTKGRTVSPDDAVHLGHALIELAQWLRDQADKP